MTHPQVYIVHGYMASPTAHWFPWLQQQLEAQGLGCQVLNLPTPEEPEPQAWQYALKQQLKEADENSIIVAHSLGCIAALNFLRRSGTRIGAAIWVSGFAQPLPDLPILDSFTDTVVASPSDLSLSVNQQLVIAAKDDSIVPHHFSEDFAAQLNAPLKMLISGGHFLAEDGYSRFPELLEQLLLMIDGLAIE